MLLQPCVWSYAAENCQTEVRVNDPQAVIKIDGKAAGHSPVIVQCKANEQVIRIDAPDKQSFTRVMAGESDFDPSDSAWDVRLQYSRGSALSAQASTSNLDLKGSEQSQVINEIRELRRLVEALALAHQGHPSSNAMPTASISPAPVVKVTADVIPAPAFEPSEVAAKSETEQTATLSYDETPDAEIPEATPAQETKIISREITLPVAAPTATATQTAGHSSPAVRPEKAERAPAAALDGAVVLTRQLKGIFVQLHALLDARLDESAVIGELQAFKDRVSVALVKFCQVPNVGDAPQWTKVLVGPLADVKAAQDIIEKIGHGTFMLRNPSCVSPSSGEDKKGD